MTPEMQEMLDALGSRLGPMVEAAVTKIAGAGAKATAPVVTPDINMLDHYIQQLNGNAAPVVTADLDVEARLDALEQHVAALTVASGHSTTQAMVTAKVAAAGLPTVADLHHQAVDNASA